MGAASDLADALNTATQTVQQVRGQADADIAGSVSRLNDLLSQFQTVNTRIKQGTAAGADVTDDLDQRDQILTSISEEIGVRTVTRADGDMAIYCVITYMDTVEGVYFPEGGMHAVPRALAGAAEKAGVEFRYNTTVDGVVRTLVSRGLIVEVGTDADTGAGLFRTTDLFLERMGMESLEELPSLAPLLPDLAGLDVDEL